MRLFFVLLFLLWRFHSNAQNIEPLKFEELKSRVTLSNDTLYVLNFWATWCKPCIEELPYFEKYDSVYKNKPLKIFLINLDFNSQLKSAVIPFVRKKKLHSSIKHITETNSGLWINKADSSWSGAIPATLMYRKSKKVFFREGSMTEKELQDVLDLKLNHN